MNLQEEIEKRSHEANGSLAIVNTDKIESLCKQYAIEMCERQKEIIQKFIKSETAIIEAYKFSSHKYLAKKLSGRIKYLAPLPEELREVKK